MRGLTAHHAHMTPSYHKGRAPGCNAPRLSISKMGPILLANPQHDGRRILRGLLVRLFYCTYFCRRKYRERV
jgi:hypothetical protein